MEQSHLQVIWEQILANMQESGAITEITYRNWLSPVTPLSLIGNKMTLGAPTPTHERFIRDRYLPRLEDAIYNVIGEHCTIDLQNLNLPQKEVVFPAASPAAHGNRRRQKTKMSSPENAPIQTTLLNDTEGLKEDLPGGMDSIPSASFGKPSKNIEVYASHELTDQIAPGDTSSLNPKYTFDTFVTGKSNQFAHAAALAVAETPGRTFNPLFMYGGVGLGKTHLMHAIGHQIIKNFPEKRVLYVSSEQFTNELINAIKDGDPEHFRQKYRSIDVLLVDDVQFISGKQSTQEEFFHTFNTLHDSGRAIILSSDRSPHEVDKLEERLRSRFEWGLIADVQPPDFETRIAILKKKAQQDNLNVPIDVMVTIANTIDSNIRELEGALTRVVAYASLTHQPVTVAVTEETLKNLFPCNRPKQITVELIQNIVAAHFQVSIDDLHAKKKTKEIVYPRQIAMYLCRELTSASLPQIANFFGKKDHTTVLHAYDKISKNKETDAKLNQDIQELTERIQKQ